jgi:hypothetical protein
MSRRMVVLWCRALSVAAAVLALTPGADAQDTNTAIGNIQAIAEAIRECWVPPPENRAREGMTVTVRFALKGNGEVTAEPRIAYVTEGAQEAERDAYRESIVAAFVRCGAFPLSAELRRTIVGKLLWLQFVDNRKKDGEHSF